MKKFSHRGGVVGRRTRALDRLQKVKKPNKRELKEIEILENSHKEEIQQRNDAINKHNNEIAKFGKESDLSVLDTALLQEYKKGLEEANKAIKDQEKRLTDLQEKGRSVGKLVFAIRPSRLDEGMPPHLQILEKGHPKQKEWKRKINYRIIKHIAA